MDTIKPISSFELINVVADPRRLRLLRLLMAAPATLTMLGKAVGEHPARVRHHLKQLEAAGLVEMVRTHVVRGFVEKYYSATAQAFFVDEVILPASAPGEGGYIFCIGSHDLGLNLALQLASQTGQPAHYLSLAIGSLDGLIALRRGLAHLAGCHLLDPESGEYNTSFVRRFFPDMPIALVTLAQREQGLILPPGNPRQVHGLADLERKDLVFVNRNRGAGTRLWLDQQLRRQGLAPIPTNHPPLVAQTHTETAAYVAAGRAHLGLGLYAAARQAGLDFIPLFAERFDLALPAAELESPRLSPLLDLLQTAGFRRQLEDLGGYGTAQTGNVILVD